VTKSRKMRWVGHVARVGERREAIKDLGGENSGIGTLGISFLRRENNIKMDFKEMGWEHGLE
jgi:hypothetical protein